MSFIITLKMCTVDTYCQTPFCHFLLIKINSSGVRKKCVQNIEEEKKKGGGKGER